MRLVFSDAHARIIMADYIAKTILPGVVVEVTHIKQKYDDDIEVTVNEEAPPNG